MSPSNFSEPWDNIFPNMIVTRGINIEISDGAKVKDLLDHIKIHGTKGIIVVAEGKLLKPEDKLGDSCSVQIFQSVFGG